MATGGPSVSAHEYARGSFMRLQASASIHDDVHEVWHHVTDELKTFIKDILVFHDKKLQG